MLCISTQAEDLQGTRHYLAIQSLFCSKKYIRNSNSIIIIIIIVDIKTIVTTINRIQNLLEIHFVFITFSIYNKCFKIMQKGCTGCNIKTNWKRKLLSHDENGFSTAYLNK